MQAPAEWPVLGLAAGGITGCLDGSCFPPPRWRFPFPPFVARWRFRSFLFLRFFRIFEAFRFRVRMFFSFQNGCPEDGYSLFRHCAWMYTYTYVRHGMRTASQCFRNSTRSARFTSFCSWLAAECEQIRTTVRREDRRTDTLFAGLLLFTSLAGVGRVSSELNNIFKSAPFVKYSVLSKTFTFDFLPVMKLHSFLNTNKKF